MEEKLNIASLEAKKTKKVVWMSGGVSSFIAGLLSQDVDEWIYIHVADQHEDTLRFIEDCEQFLSRKITILKSDKFSCVQDVVRTRNFLNGPHGAPCTSCLKRSVRLDWEKQFPDTKFTYVWGYDLAEKARADRMRESDKGKYVHEFPLIDRGLSKQDCHAILRLTGIERPLLYRLGFPNNNCIGCLKSGQFTWGLVRKYFPEKFAERARLEREQGHSCLKNMFLDELPENSGRKTQSLEEENLTLTLSALLAAQELGL
ncbi:MAG: phosphoadenosine phosphosulfate reductase [Lachnospiraceae bacterium]|nr:phosphoadenosine phosphosulfate reductase [Lachnospiraceae bacterium]